MDTLKLDSASWDLTKDEAGNIAMESGAEAQAQDAASAIQLFLGELYYDTTKGVPYFQQILGLLPPLSLVKAKFVAAAMTVPGVATARCFISSVADRTITGQVQITNEDGDPAVASF